MKHLGQQQHQNLVTLQKPDWWFQVTVFIFFVFVKRLWIQLWQPYPNKNKMLYEFLQVVIKEQLNTLNTAIIIYAVLKIVWVSAYKPSLSQLDLMQRHLCSTVKLAFYTYFWQGTRTLVHYCIPLHLLQPWPCLLLTEIQNIFGTVYPLLT